jgi:septum formation protein
MKRIVLASSSPRRRELLEQAGIPHEVISGDVDEEAVEMKGTPEEYAVRLAQLKAESVANSIERGLVIGADTIVALNGTVFGKPVNNAEAADMLRKLSGKVHTVITGIALIDKHQNKADSSGTSSISIRTDFEATKVKFVHL